MEENNNVAPKPQGESKAAIGFVCAFFLGLIGLIIGFCCFPAGSYERKTFFKGYWITFGVTVGVSLLAIIVLFSMYGTLLMAYLQALMSGGMA